jgi:hypothetical protein
VYISSAVEDLAVARPRNTKASLTSFISRWSEVTPRIVGVLV